MPLSLAMRRFIVVGQRLIGGNHIGEFGVAALARILDRVKDGRHAGRIAVRGIRMPEVAAVDQADGLAVPDIVGEHQHLGIARHRIVGVELIFERAEAPRKRELRGGRKALIADDEHLVGVEGIADLRKIAVGERAQIDAQNFRAHARA